MSKPRLGAGNVEFDLDGDTAVLRPTLKAAQTISRRAGGIMGAIDAVGKYDVDVLTAIVALGLDKEPKDVAEKVWRTGYQNVVPSVVRFLEVLANGGRPPAEGGEGDADPPAS